MAIGINYDAPYYYEIDFNPTDVRGQGKVDIDAIIPVPAKHRVIGKLNYNSCFNKYGMEIPVSAPSGTKNMRIVQL